MDKNTENRYFDYILSYTNTVLELGDELREKCKKSRGGDIIINKKKYVFFSLTNWVTLLNKKNDLEITFTFNDLDDFIYFNKENLHNFIESDLNASGLWKHFPSNKTKRAEIYNECLEKNLSLWKIQKKDNWYMISK